MAEGREQGAGQHAAQYELLKAISEQYREKIIEYDVASDTISVYNVIDGQFVKECEVGGYVGEQHLGETFVAEEDREEYRRVFVKCLKKPTHMVVDLRCALAGDPMEWNRLYLVSVTGRDKEVVRVGGRFVSIHKDKLFTEQMRMRAEIDALTGVYNHVAFEEVCGNALEACDTNAFFLMLDVDDFKRINDTQGHTVGDMVLRQTGAILNKTVKNCGVAGRLGGDEFALLVWGIDEREMRKLCSSLRQELKTVIFDTRYSASMGVSATDGRTVTFQDLYGEADQAVYAAKNGGKDRVVFYQEMKEDAVDSRIDNYETVSFGEVNERSLLAEFGKCMNFLTRESYRAGLKKLLDSLLEYFDADCTALISWQEDRYLGIDERHREEAAALSRILTDTVKRGGMVQFLELIDAKGNVFLKNVKEIADSYPDICRRLTQSRVWSMAGHEMRMDFVSRGILLVINPRKHLPERLLLRMMADYLVSRMMTQRVMELREHETTHDRLTGLWNRNSFILTENAWRNDMYGPLGIVTTDIVGLSYVNRDFGYLVGSRKLVAIARVLQEVFAEFRIFRYDGDEMLVCCPNVQQPEFESLLTELRGKLKELDFKVALGCSWSRHANLAEQLVEAQLIMGNDKTYLMQSGELQACAEQSVIDEVNRNLREGNYLVYMQPKVNVHTKETVGAEALIRQIDPDLGMVSPAVFVPVLERYNLIHMIDLFVLEQVFRFQREAIDAGRRLIPISTNFSRLTILHPDLLARVSELTDKYRIPEGLIHIEVTETVGDMDHMMIDRVADSLKELGFKLSMDDFGTHYSNLAVLIQYDFDSAKIDRSMIMDITTNEKSRIVVNYMASLISELGINCIAEGVETKEQVEIMKETKCEVIQGYYFGKPVPQEDFYRLYVEEGENSERENHDCG